ncbi:MAG TPA: hypothetical protein PL000_21975, partial [Anaerolineales bacterium]|nr:hypothetical protein [Anaerolineales bacterium]
PSKWRLPRMSTAKRTKFQIRSDAAKQRWVRDDRKEAFWRKHIEAWKASGMSKRAYSRAHNLSESSFNAWIREIALREREYVPTENVATLLADSKNPFVPIRLVSDNEGKAAPLQPVPQVITPPHDSRVEIVVPGGAVMRVSDTCNVEFVAQLFSFLKSGDSAC